MSTIEKRQHYHGHRARLREKIRKDPKGFADYEILELLLTHAVPVRDTKPLAKELLDRFKTLEGVLYAPMEQLKSIKGFGEALEAFWIVLREFQARQREAPLRKREVLSDPSIVADLARSRIGHAAAEEFWVALVDNKNRLMGWERISLGTVDRTVVFPREVLALALKHQASGIVLVHNHPGGDPAPSGQDIELTRRISRAATELDVRILDHVIVAEQGYYSFQERGML